MTSVSAVSGSASVDPAGISSRPRSGAAVELAKCKKDLANWVDCPSGRTSAGKAKIAEITDKISALKAEVERAEKQKPTETKSREVAVAQSTPTDVLRFDGVGSYVSVRA